tara:strand:+ start:196 stop:306 length:111 start_codon:yes stop_codon:yes gene_type:complete
MFAGTCDWRGLEKNKRKKKLAQINMDGKHFIAVLKL